MKNSFETNDTDKPSSISKPFEDLTIESTVELDDLPATERIPRKLNARLEEYKQRNALQIKMQQEEVMNMLQNSPDATYAVEEWKKREGGYDYVELIPVDYVTDNLKINVDKLPLLIFSSIKESISRGLLDSKYYENEKNNPNNIRRAMIDGALKMDSDIGEKVVTTMSEDAQFEALAEAVENNIDINSLNCLDLVMIHDAFQRKIDGLAGWSTTTKRDRERVSKEWDRLMVIYEAVPEDFRPNLGYANKWIWEKKSKAFSRDENE